MTDTLPIGLELVKDPSRRTLSQNLGTIVPGKSQPVTFTAKVTSTKDGDVITNEACFDGNSSAGDAKQHSCWPDP